MWTFLRKHKGRKFSHGAKQPWHTWDRPKEEVLLSKRVSLAIKALRTRAVERGILTNVDGDWERGRANSSSSELVFTGELIQGWDEEFAALWIEAMDEANLRE